jgi:hypothetical protein
MSITPFTLTAALAAMGSAEVFVGDPFQVGGGGMESLGATEGEIRANFPTLRNPLTAPEFTGDATHADSIRWGDVTVTVPLILGDEDLWAKIMPLGYGGGGHSTPQQPTTTSVLIIPRAELGATLARPTGGPWAPAPPVNAFWLWKAWPSIDALPYRFDNGGKVITEVTFHGMWDTARPEGAKMFYIGDPATYSTPINVII